jgi:HSP20 family protein
MAETPSKTPAEPQAEKSGRNLGEWHPLAGLRREIDRLFEDFNLGTRRWPVGSAFDVEPFWRSELSFGKTPAVDIAERDKEYEIIAELPGMSEENIDVKFADGVWTLKGEKKEKKEEKEKDYYRSERRFGSFQCSFRVPDGVNADKIEAQAA